MKMVMAPSVVSDINAGLEDIVAVGHQLQQICDESDRITQSDLPNLVKLDKLVELRDRAAVLEQRRADIIATLTRLAPDDS